MTDSFALWEKDLNTPDVSDIPDYETMSVRELMELIDEKGEGLMDAHRATRQFTQTEMDDYNIYAGARAALKRKLG